MANASSLEAAIERRADAAHFGRIVPLDAIVRARTNRAYSDTGKRARPADPRLEGTDYSPERVARILESQRQRQARGALRYGRLGAPRPRPGYLLERDGL